MRHELARKADPALRVDSAALDVIAARLETAGQQSHGTKN